MAPPAFVSQSGLADLLGVDKSRVSRWIKDGKIGKEAITGTGRNLRINVEMAKAHLAARLDAGQALGNGARTKRAAASSSAPAAAPPARRPAKVERPAPEPSDAEPAAVADDLDPDSTDYQVQRARLVKAQADAQERKNAKEAGELLDADMVERRWTAILTDVRTYMLAVPGRVRDALPELSASQVAKIDAEVRRALTDAGNGTASEED